MPSHAVCFELDTTATRGKRRELTWKERRKRQYRGPHVFEFEVLTMFSSRPQHIATTLSLRHLNYHATKTKTSRFPTSTITGI